MPGSYHPKFRSKCYLCGKCCTYLVKLTRKDIKKIESLGYKEKDFVHSHFGKSTVNLVDGKCFFLRIDEKGNNYCEIYDSRPKVCIIYPDKDPSITTCPHFEDGFLKKSNLC